MFPCQPVLVPVRHPTTAVQVRLLHRAASLNQYHRLSRGRPVGGYQLRQGANRGMDFSLSRYCGNMALLTWNMTKNTDLDAVFDCNIILSDDAIHHPSQRRTCWTRLPGDNEGEDS